MRYARPNIEPFGVAYVALQACSLGQRLIGIILGRAMERSLLPCRDPNSTSHTADRHGRLAQMPAPTRTPKNREVSSDLG